PAARKSPTTTIAPPALPPPPKVPPTFPVALAGSNPGRNGWRPDQIPAREASIPKYRPGRIECLPPPTPPPPNSSAPAPTSARSHPRRRTELADRYAAMLPKNAHSLLRPAARAWAAESNPEKPRGIAAIFGPPATLPSSDNALPGNRNLPAFRPAIATSLPPPTPRPRRP